MRAQRPVIRASSSSSSRSGRSISSRKSWNCCRELVLKPTQPSAVGSIEGSSIERAGVPATFGRPNMLFNRSVYIVPAMFMTSSSEKSMCSPRPSPRARRTAASAATAANVPPIHSVVRPPAITGGCEASPRVAIEPDSAWTVNSVAGRPA
jgi:hypothetical protein